MANSWVIWHRHCASGTNTYVFSTEATACTQQRGSQERSTAAMHQLPRWKVRIAKIVGLLKTQKTDAQTVIGIVVLDRDRDADTGLVFLADDAQAAGIATAARAKAALQQQFVPGAAVQQPRWQFTPGTEPAGAPLGQPAHYRAGGALMRSVPWVTT